jgi:hypothetical protein
MKQVNVYLEVSPKKTFACAYDWPGWCRAGKTEADALEALGTYAPRYAAVAATAGLAFDASATLEVVDRVEGNATTAFGAPGTIAPRDVEGSPAEARERALLLLQACWRVFDEVVAASPAELRKGPRGGGRDRDKMVGHVLEAEVAYANYVGLKLRMPDASSLAAHRRTLLEAIGRAGTAVATPEGKRRWPMAYIARRVAWHVLDHAWEMADRRSAEG